MADPADELAAAGEQASSAGPVIVRRRGLVPPALASLAVDLGEAVGHRSV